MWVVFLAGGSRRRLGLVLLPLFPFIKIPVAVSLVATGAGLPLHVKRIEWVVNILARGVVSCLYICSSVAVSSRELGCFVSGQDFC